ncbi:ATP-binding protein [Streptomyces sp. NPDC054841]
MSLTLSTAPLPGPRPAAPWTDAAPSDALRPLVPYRSPDAQLTLPAHEALVGCFRDVASGLLTCWCLSDEARDAAVLIVGELAANAARHGRSEMSLCLILDPNTLYIVVIDHGDPAPPRESTADDDPDEHGRGLDIVRALSALDMHQDDRGTWVLASLPVAAAQTRAA